jgi:hypothetical protein
LLTGAETDPLSLTYGAPIEILAVTPYSYTPFPGETFSDSALSHLLGVTRPGILWLVRVLQTMQILLQSRKHSPPQTKPGIFFAV